MKSPKKLLILFLVSCIIVLGVNFAGNYQYYMAGNDWHYSVFFSLSITTLGWVGGMSLYYLFFRNIQWTVRPTQKLLTSVLLFAIFGVAMMLVAMKVMVLLFHFREQATQDYIYNCTYSALFTIIIGLMTSGQQFLFHLKKSIQDNEQMKQEMIQSRYETLKSQVNPHFLFNSLNTLTVMIPKQPEIAVNFVEQMSKVFRYSLQHSGENTMDVSAELKVVKSYLFLNEQRYDGKFVTEIKIDEGVLNQKIITQSLLMLVENAIKHNEISHENPLSLSIYNEGNYLIVKNTLQRKSLIEKSTNVGLENIRKRYALASEIPVVIEEIKNSFIVKIPLLK
jgi:two-component system LytT family sensor kinase